MGNGERISPLRPVFWLAVLLVGTPPLSAQTVIPLQVQQVPESSGPGTKYAVGLSVGLGGGPPKLFQLDTGSGAFYAAYSSSLDEGVDQWWGGTPTPIASDFSDSFGGQTIFFDTVSTTVQLYSGTTVVAQSGPVAVGQVTSSENEETGAPTDWASLTAAGQPALHQTYYGNFGARLSWTETPNLFSVLGQMTGAGGAAIQGFRIHLGNLASATEQPTLTLYFAGQTTPASTYPYAIPLAPGGGAPFPVTGLPTTADDPETAQAFTINGATSTAGSYTGLFDTGGTGFEIPTDPAYPGYGNDSQVPAGQLFYATFVGSPGYPTFDLAFMTGSVSGINAVEVVSAPPPAPSDLNFGLEVYNYYDVYFDIAGSRVFFSPLAWPSLTLLQPHSRKVTKKSVQVPIAATVSGVPGALRFIVKARRFPPKAKVRFFYRGAEVTGKVTHAGLVTPVLAVNARAVLMARIRPGSRRGTGALNVTVSPLGGPGGIRKTMPIRFRPPSAGN